MNTSPTPESSAQPVIQIQKMNKWFGQFHVLKEIDLEVVTGERIVICGPFRVREIHANSLYQST